METQSKYFERIDIKSENDLPGGKYIHHSREGWVDFGEVYWQDDIDWYLLPVSSPAVTGPTDEMIDTEARLFEQNDIILDTALGKTLTVVSFTEGANYYKSQLKPVDLKAFLKDFNSWMCGKQYDGQIPLIDRCIEEYFDYLHKTEEGK